jgi:hypothetical protein
MDIVVVPNEGQLAKISLMGIVSQFGINLILVFGTFVLFSFLRPRNNMVYAPKQFASENAKQPPNLEENMWGWVKPVLNASETSLIKEIGLDAVMFIRFIKLCRNVSLCLFLFGFGVIMPANIFSTYHDNNYDIDNFLKILSISYLKQVSNNFFFL